MKLGIIGTGKIAKIVSSTLAQMPKLELHAVASRDINRAIEFAQKYGYKKAYGKYEDLYNDKDVELVYICTPHPEHIRNITDAINAGKHVICEKPITINAHEAEYVFNLAKEKGVYLTEAMWIRYMPFKQIVKDILDSDIIGNPRMITACDSFAMSHIKRIMDKSMAGGALLDIGVYGINFALMFLGDDIKKVTSSVNFANTGIDASENITIRYTDGKLASLSFCIDCDGGHEGIIHCERGHILIDDINCPTSYEVFDANRKLIKHDKFPIKISGYEYEFEESINCINKGKLESDSMPHSESVKVMNLCDQIKSEWIL